MRTLILTDEEHDWLVAEIKVAIERAESYADDEEEGAEEEAIVAQGILDKLEEL